MLRLTQSSQWTHQWEAPMTPDPNPFDNDDIREEWFNLPKKIIDIQRQLNTNNYELFAENLLDVSQFTAFLAKEIMEGLPSKQIDQQIGEVA